MAEINVTEITTGSVEGTGVFDLLMKSISAQLESERIAGRISNTDFAGIYTASLAAALSTASTFVLGKQQADKQAELLVEQALQATTQTALIASQKLTSDQQVLLATQKVRTEEAQILDIVNSNAVAGLIGKQKELYTKQIDGYQRDAEQKAAKLLTDAWNLRRSTDSNFSEVGTGLENNNCQAALAKVFEGINVTQLTP